MLVNTLCPLKHTLSHSSPPPSYDVLMHMISPANLGHHFAALSFSKGGKLQELEIGIHSSPRRETRMTLQSEDTT